MKNNRLKQANGKHKCSLFLRLCGIIALSTALSTTAFSGHKAVLLTDTAIVPIPIPPIFDKAAAPIALPQLKGTWLGQGYQQDANSIWDIKLVCKHGRYTISYPGLGCSGKWKIVEKKERMMLFREEITEGKEQCYTNGFMMIEPIAPGLLKFSIFHPNLNTLNAVGFLAQQ